jgi:hypothetical protein
MDAPMPLREAIASLRNQGFEIGPDKLHRWRYFGIASFRSGRSNSMNAAVYRNLEYVLQIEGRFGFARNHHALALELAYRRYPTIPWDRVHDGARKELRTFFNGVSRELHRIDDSSGDGFLSPRFKQLASKIARRFIPNRKIKEDPSRKLPRDVIAQVANLWLRVAYNNEIIEDYKIRPILYTMGAKDPAALDAATDIAKLLSQVVPILRLGSVTTFDKVLEPRFSVEQIRTTVETMHTLYGFNAHMREAGVSLFESQTVAYPAIEGDTSSHRIDVALRGMMYAGAAYFEETPLVKNAIDLLKSGQLRDVSAPIDALAQFKSTIINHFTGSPENG